MQRLLTADLNLTRPPEWRASQISPGWNPNYRDAAQRDFTGERGLLLRRNCCLVGQATGLTQNGRPRSVLVFTNDHRSADW